MVVVLVVVVSCVGGAGVEPWAAAVDDMGPEGSAGVGWASSDDGGDDDRGVIVLSALSVLLAVLALGGAAVDCSLVDGGCLGFCEGEGEPLEIQRAMSDDAGIFFGC